MKMNSIYVLPKNSCQTLIGFKRIEKKQAIDLKKFSEFDKEALTGYLEYEFEIMNDSFISNLKISKHFSEGSFGEVNKKNSLKIYFFF